MSGKAKKEFPNNWKRYADIDASSFMAIEFEDFMDWKVFGWEIPGNICCLIRERNMTTGKVREHTYQRPSAADKKIQQLTLQPNVEFIICTDEHVCTVPAMQKKSKDAGEES
jgi:hypothetical protein